MADVLKRDSEDLRDQSTAALVRQLTEQVSTLVREEAALARQEMKQKGRRAGAGAAALGASAALALFGGGGLVAAAILAIAQVLRPWLAALVVGAALLVLAGMAVLVGKGQIRRATPPLPTETRDHVREDVEAVKGRMHR